MERRPESEASLHHAGKTYSSGYIHGIVAGEYNINYIKLHDVDSLRPDLLRCANGTALF